MKKMTMTLIGMGISAAVVLSACSSGCPFGFGKTEKQPSDIFQDPMGPAQSEVFQPYAFPVPARPAGQEDMIEFTCAPIKNVRVAFIGLGMRGGDAVRRFTHIDGATIVGLADPDKGYLKNAVNRVRSVKGEEAAKALKTYDTEEGWKKLCEDPDIDLVYICTPWEMHVPMAVYAMENGKHAVMEVPATLSLDECWLMVNTAEKTRKHCMMIENCNYDFFEMAVNNMAREGLFGEVLHAEGAYIHDLRSLYHRGYKNDWRFKECMYRDGNPYATHGLGPIAHIMNIHRGDRMTHLVSLGTRELGMTAYNKEKAGKNCALKDSPFRMADMNTTIIRTAKGKTIMLQHDVTSPRPYSRLFTISGTQGFAQKYPGLPKEWCSGAIVNTEGLTVGTGSDFNGLSFEPNSHGFLSVKERDAMIEKYQHPIIREYGKKARQVGGHGGMDFIMDCRLIYCLNNGLPLDQDVYDAAEWSCIADLTQKSAENNGMPVVVPDFTRGAWKKINQVNYYTVESFKKQTAK